MHGWNHNLEVANTRISGNHGTLTGGINLGNGETPAVFINDGADLRRRRDCRAAMPCPPMPERRTLRPTRRSRSSSTRTCASTTT